MNGLNGPPVSSSSPVSRHDIGSQPDSRENARRFAHARGTGSPSRRRSARLRDRGRSDRAEREIEPAGTKHRGQQRRAASIPRPEADRRLAEPGVDAAAGVAPRYQAVGDGGLASCSRSPGRVQRNERRVSACDNLPHIWKDATRRLERFESRDLSNAGMTDRAAIGAASSGASPATASPSRSHRRSPARFATRPAAHCRAWSVQLRGHRDATSRQSRTVAETHMFDVADPGHSQVVFTSMNFAAVRRDVS